MQAHRPPRRVVLATLPLILGFLAACEEGADPAAPPIQTDAQLSVVPTNPGPTLGSPDPEYFEVCKVFSGPGASSATANFTYTVDIGSTGAVDFNGSFSLVDGECLDIWVAGGQAISTRDLVTVNETGPSGVTVTHQAYYLGLNSGPSTGQLLSGSQFTEWTNAAQGVTVYFYNEFPSIGGEGCTPGYWRQPQHFDSWEGYQTTDLLSQYFDLPATLERPEGGVDPASLDLLDAVTLRGGKINAVTRHAVAAILNAASSGVNYDLSEGEIVALYNQAVATGSWKDALATLVEFNEQFCGLN